MSQRPAPVKVPPSRPRALSNLRRESLRTVKSPVEQTPDVHYTVFVRLPIPRGNFIDPPPIDWDGTKDRALWRILSSTPKSGGLDWHEISARFDVPITFILQQAAWLYERQLMQVRAQMRKVNAPNASSPSHSNTSAAAREVGGLQMRRLGSTGSRGTASNLSGSPRDTPITAPQRSGSGTPQMTGPQVSRTPSTKTITRLQRPPDSPRQPSNLSFPNSIAPLTKIETQSRRSTQSTASPTVPTSGTPLQTLHSPIQSQPESETVSSDGSSSSSNYDSAIEPVRRSQTFRRPIQFSKSKRNRGSQKDSYNSNDASNEGSSRPGNDNEDEEEDDDNPSFLPFAQRQSPGKSQHSSQQNSSSITPSATLRTGPSRINSVRQQQQPQQRHDQSHHRDKNWESKTQRRTSNNQQLADSSSASAAAASLSSSSGRSISEGNTDGANANSATSKGGRQQMGTRVTSNPVAGPSRTQRAGQPPTSAAQLKQSAAPDANPTEIRNPQPAGRSSTRNDNGNNNNNNNNTYNSSQSQPQSQRNDQTQLSPRQRALRREGAGSDGGTPSMGSSFSDLDDTSVTQSALEEALMSNMQRGAIASRMSSLSQALRSKYL